MNQELTKKDVFQSVVWLIAIAMIVWVIHSVPEKKRTVSETEYAKQVTQSCAEGLAQAIKYHVLELPAP